MTLNEAIWKPRNLDLEVPLLNGKAKATLVMVMLVNGRYDVKLRVSVVKGRLLPPDLVDQVNQSLKGAGLKPLTSEGVGTMVSYFPTRQTAETVAAIRKLMAKLGTISPEAEDRLTKMATVTENFDAGQSAMVTSGDTLIGTEVMIKAKHFPDFKKSRQQKREEFLAKLRRSGISGVLMADHVTRAMAEAQGCRDCKDGYCDSCDRTAEKCVCVNEAAQTFVGSVQEPTLAGTDDDHVPWHQIPINQLDGYRHLFTVEAWMKLQNVIAEHADYDPAWTGAIVMHARTLASSMKTLNVTRAILDQALDRSARRERKSGQWDESVQPLNEGEWKRSYQVTRYRNSDQGDYTVVSKDGRSKLVISLNPAEAVDDQGQEIFVYQPVVKVVTTLSLKVGETHDPKTLAYINQALSSVGARPLQPSKYNVGELYAYIPRGKGDGETLQRLSKFMAKFGTVPDVIKDL